MDFAQAENTDHDSVTAQLHADTNHPGSDVILTDHYTGQVEEVQLKAVHDPAEVYHALERYPDVPVYVTDEVARQVEQPHVYDSGFSNQQLTSDVTDTVHHLEVMAQTPLDYLPHIALWSTALAAAPVVQSWSRGYISREECIHQVARITGWKVVKVASILAFLSFP
ncbi:MAG: hypothetical protein PHO01_09740 [Desulfotomaculaceae bacterium]|nr:hypothetical protein [Desulfotomaculaceae bacterium]